jgi:hypothetical protein
MEERPRGTRRLALDTGPNTLAGRMRAARFKLFEQLLVDLPSPARILDIGGTNYFWELRGLAGDPSVLITIANIFEQERAHDNIAPLEASATDLADLADDSFDLVFSNSTIEHLFTWEAQRSMAREVRRLAPAYFVQTPNFWFPVEPHFLTLGWHWLPTGARIALLKRRRYGHRGPFPVDADAREAVEEIRILRPAEMKELFPDAKLHRERVGPLTKSLISIRVPVAAGGA